MRKIYVLFALLVTVASCQFRYADQDAMYDCNDKSGKTLLKSLLSSRETRWTVDELDIPELNNGWYEIKTDKELAFLLEFGSTSGEKYRLMANIEFSDSDIAFKMSSEIGVEKFENFEFDGNGCSISGLDLQMAAGLFSRVKNSKIYNLTIQDCSVGDQANVSNLLGTGMLIGHATGNIETSGIMIRECSVQAPCKVGGAVGSITDAVCSFKNCSVVDTDIETVYLKGISGGCGGFCGFVGREVERSREVAVIVSIEGCSVTGGSVKAHMQSATRYSGRFIGTINGYDYRETIYMTGCVVDNVFVGQDTAAAEFTPLSSEMYVGGDKYGRGTVSVDGIDLTIPWDGVTLCEPMASEAAYDGVSGGYVVCRADELAYLAQNNNGTYSSKPILIRHDLDLGGTKGVNFTPFNSISHLNGLKPDGSNSTIYNLKVYRNKCTQKEGAAFIIKASGTTVHEYLDFSKAKIEAFHDANNSEAGGNAYCATLCGNIEGTSYTVTDVNVYDGYLYGVDKMGGLVGRLASTLSDISSCSVNGYHIKNYEVNDMPEVFEGTAEKMGFTITATATFYPQGEVGGMIGFISSSANIKDCHVYETRIEATGQDDQKAKLSGNQLAVGILNAAGGYLVPGRHVSTFIGDIRTAGSKASHAVVISGCSVDQATKNNISPTWDKHSSNVDFIGQCYYIYGKDKSDGTVTVDGSQLSDIKHCIQL